VVISGRPETRESGDCVNGEEDPEEVRNPELSVETVRERGGARARMIEPTASCSCTCGVTEGNLGVVSSGSGV
jgi:hypothetical protein